MSQPVLILADLDDTLFQTRAKCGNTTLEDLRLMSWLGDGAPSGYATRPQQTLLAWLEHATLVPVTARSREVLGRVNIVQAPAICANGGCIVGAEGVPDRAWHAHLETLSAAGDGPAAVYPVLVDGLPSQAYRHWVAQEEGLGLYIVIKSNHGDLVGLNALGDELELRLPAGWRSHRNGNNLAFLPPWLSKRAAVAHYLTEIHRAAPEWLVIGVGDSWSDAGFLDLCHMAMMPTGSQLWQAMAVGNPWIAPPLAKEKA